MTSPARPAWLRNPALLAIAFLIFATAVLAVYRPWRRSPPASPPVPAPTASVRLIAPRQDVNAPPSEFSWEPVPGASQYRVRIADADALWPIFVKMTTNTKLVLGPNEVTAITAGRIHEWEVEALDDKGQPIALGYLRFRFMPPEAPSDKSPPGRN